MEASQHPNQDISITIDCDYENECYFCLGTLENKSKPNNCDHAICFECLVKWSKSQVPSEPNWPICPVCKIPYTSIRHNFKSDDVFDNYDFLSNSTDDHEVHIQIEPDEVENQCSICMNDVKKKARPNTCQHLFCFKCLKKWATIKFNDDEDEVALVCPICRGRFTTIIHSMKSDDNYKTYDPASAGTAMDKCTKFLMIFFLVLISSFWIFYIFFGHQLNLFSSIIRPKATQNSGNQTVINITTNSLENYPLQINHNETILDFTKRMESFTFQSLRGKWNKSANELKESVDCFLKGRELGFQVADCQNKRQYSPYDPNQAKICWMAQMWLDDPSNVVKLLGSCQAEIDSKTALLHKCRSSISVSTTKKPTTTENEASTQLPVTIPVTFLKLQDYCKGFQLDTTN